MPAFLPFSRRAPSLGASRLHQPIRLAPIGAVFISAVVVAGCGGPTALPSAGAGGASPSVAAIPTASLEVKPSSASAVYPTWYTGDRDGAGILSAGSPATRNFVPGFTYTVPSGWVNTRDETDTYNLIPDSPANAAEQAASGMLAHEVFAFRFGSPYWICDAWEDHRGATAAELVASIVATEAIATSEPVDVTIGGLTGKQVDIGVDPGWTETCPGDPPTLDLGDTRTRVILLDTPDRGGLFINVASLHAADHEAFLAEAMPIIESFQFDVLLARGTFTLYGAVVELSATRTGDTVAGTMTVSHESGDFSVDLKCSRTTEDGVILLAGDITDSASPYAREGAREVLVLKPGSPVYASFDSEGRSGGDVRPAASCPALLEQVMGTGTQTVIGENGLEPIEGTVEFGT